MHPASASAASVSVSVSQPLPITQVSTHNNNNNNNSSEDSDDGGGDSGLFSCAVSSFSSWGTETDSGAESDPFCFDDETSQAIIRAPSVKEQVVVVVEVDVEVGVDVGVGVGTMVVVVQRRGSLLKRWVVAVWGVVARVFRRRGKAGRAGTAAGTAAGDKAGKQS